MQVNTYQAIAITDGALRSYAVLIYECDSVQWGGEFAMGSVFARIGVSVDGKIIHSHPLSGNESVDTIDCLNHPDSRWVNLVYDISLRSSASTAATIHSIPCSALSALSIPPQVTQSGITYITVKTLRPRDRWYLEF